MNTLFSHVCVVTMDDRMSVWTDAFVGVTDSKISWLSKHAPEEKPDQIIDATGMVLMPGLINCHTHLPMQLLRGYADEPVRHVLFLRRYLRRHCQVRHEGKYLARDIDVFGRRF